MIKLLQGIGGIAVAAAVVVAIAGCAAVGSSSSTNGNTVALPASSGATTASSTVASGPEPGPFNGNSDENLGTIQVPNNTVLHWACSSCSTGNFIVGNNFNDSGTIDVNALDQTSGQTVVDGGTYHDVEVTTMGPFTLTFSH